MQIDHKFLLLVATVVLAHIQPFCFKMDRHKSYFNLSEIDQPKNHTRPEFLNSTRNLSSFDPFLFHNLPYASFHLQHEL